MTDAVGAAGNACGHALAETDNGLQDPEVIDPQRVWSSITAVEVEAVQSEADVTSMRCPVLGTGVRDTIIPAISAVVAPQALGEQERHHGRHEADTGP